MDVPIGDEKETVGKDQSTLEMVAYRDMWGKGTDSYLHMMYWREIMICAMHTYEVRPRKDHRGVDLISEALPFGKLWYGEPNCRRECGSLHHRKAAFCLLS